MKTVVYAKAHYLDWKLLLYVLIIWSSPALSKTTHDPHLEHSVNTLERTNQEATSVFCPIENKQCDIQLHKPEEISEGKSQCPHFLIYQNTITDTKSTFLIKSPQASCDQVVLASPFKEPEEFEQFLRSTPAFSRINISPIADCVRRPFTTKQRNSQSSGRGRSRTSQIPEENHNLLIAGYYSKMSRLQNKLTEIVDEIASIDHLIGPQKKLKPGAPEWKSGPGHLKKPVHSPYLEDIKCSSFNPALGYVTNLCHSLKHCSEEHIHHSSHLEHIASLTSRAMTHVNQLDQEIKKLEVQSNNPSVAKQMEALSAQQDSVMGLYPWIVGKEFLKGYSPGIKQKDMENLITKQLHLTRSKLKRKMDELNKAVNCLHKKHRQSECSDVDVDALLKETDELNADSVFPQLKKGKQDASEQKKLIYAKGLFDQVQCRDQIRTTINEQNQDLEGLAMDSFITVLAVYLAGSTIFAKVAQRIGGRMSAFTLTNVSIVASDVLLSLPYIKTGFKKCHAQRNQLSILQAGNKMSSLKYLCQYLPTKTKLVSDFKGCILTAIIASLPLTFPALAEGALEFIDKEEK